MKIVKHKKFVMTNIDNNNNKFWEAWEFEDGSTKTKWGRVSETDKTQEKEHPPGKKNFDSLCRSKEKKGYREVATIGGIDDADIKVSNVSGGGLRNLAAKQIAKGDKIIESLVTYLVKKNCHTITKNTNITYDEATGLFKTPVGIVTQDSIDEARDLLAKIMNFVRKKTFEDDVFKSFLQDYLMLIPTDVGRARGWHRTFLPDVPSVSGQNSILDALQASLDTVIEGGDKKPKKKNVPEEKVFDVTIRLNENPDEIRRIKALYNKTRQRRVHTSANLDVKRVYDVSIRTMNNAFKNHGMKMSNIWELWHGTQASNILSILAKGMVIPPANATHCTGRMYGPGVYASDQSTKALNYAYGYWSGQKDSNCFMFLLDFAMGRYYVPGRSSYSRGPLPRSGYDSTFAKAGESGVINNEMIVYSLHQTRIRRLVEFA